MSALSSVGLQIEMVAMVLAATFSGPVIAAWLLRHQKKLARERRRSPIGIDLLRSPGHALREQIDELRLDVLGDLMGMCIIPPLILTVHLVQSYMANTPETIFRSGLSAATALGITGVMIRRLLLSHAKLDTLRLGLDAEMAVGQQLDQLMRQGAAVFHDVPAENFNIDHVVIAPQGVFAIETKGFSKRGDLSGKERAHVSFDGKCLRFPGWVTSEPLEQAERQAKWLASWLSKAAAIDTVVHPILALPGRFVERKAEGTVKVYSGAELKWLLSRASAAKLTPKTIDVLAYQLDQRCRDVVPTYRA